MKVLFLVSRTVLGGHVLSAFTVARYMAKRGHTIIFAGGRGKLATRIEAEFPYFEVPIPFYHGQRECYFTWKSFKAIGPLREIIRRHHIEIVHAFDARAYIHASIASLLEQRPITCTLCGGIDPHYNIPVTGRVIVFSAEQRQKMIGQFKWQPERVEVIRTRVDVDSIINDHSPPPVRLKFEHGTPVMMMISSFDNTKADSILQVMDALDLLIEQHIDFQMVFIGGKGTFFEKMKERAARTNKQAGREIFIFTGPVVDAFRLLKKADIVMGVGRSAFEGMAYAKPTIVVGANGFAGVVSEENVDEIGYYNFSGRNQRVVVSPKLLAEALTNLLADARLRQAVGKFGQQYVCKEIDVKEGLGRIEEVYRYNRDVNTAGFRMKQWLSLGKIMIPIWRDNWWHTVGVPLKRMLGKKLVLDEILDEQGVA